MTSSGSYLVLDTVFVLKENAAAESHVGCIRLRSDNVRLQLATEFIDELRDGGHLVAISLGI